MRLERACTWLLECIQSLQTVGEEKAVIGACMHGHYVYVYPINFSAALLTSAPEISVQLYICR